MEHIELIRECRICKNPHFQKVLDLGNQYIANAFHPKEEPPTLTAPLMLMRCDKCGLVQLAHSINTDLMYRNYWYKSSINKTMRDHLEDLVDKIITIQPVKSGDTVIDIACNDGYMLGCYKQTVNRIGVDPSNIKPANCTQFFNNYFSAGLLQDVPKAKIITTIAMFYDLNDPKKFVRDIESCLAPDGVWVLELAYLRDILSATCYDTCCVKPGTLLLGCNKNIENIKVTDKVINECGELVEVVRPMNRVYKGDLIKIKPRYLEEITLTPEHPVKIVRRNNIKFKCGQFRKKPIHKFEWVNAGKIEFGDYMVIPRINTEINITEINLSKYNMLDSKHYRFGLQTLPINTNTAWLLGLYVAEGHVDGKNNNRNINFTLNITEKHLSDKLTIVAKKLGYKANTILKKDRNIRTVKITCCALARAFADWFGDRAKHKKIPEFLMTAPKTIRTAFLRGLFDGDGFIDETRNQVHFHSASKTLVMQTQLMVASLGGMLGISYVKPYLNRKIRGSLIKSGDSWQLRGRSQILSKIFDYQYKNNNSISNNHIVTNDYILVPIEAIDKEYYDGKVYNLETKTHTYLVSNATVHNCHEHVCYYRLGTFEMCLEGTNLEVFKVEFNKINGGSFRIYVANKGARKIDSEVTNTRDWEKYLFLDSDRPYHEFVSRVEKSREELMVFLMGQKIKGKKIWGYGASTKGQVTMQYCNINSDLMEAVAERNPDKYGLFTPGTDVQIRSEDEMRTAKPDYLVIFPWHFLTEFKEREKGLMASGTKLVVPLPRFEVI